MARPGVEALAGGATLGLLTAAIARAQLAPTVARMATRLLIGHVGNAAGICTEFGALADTPCTIVVLSNSTISTCVSVTGKILQVLGPTWVPKPT